MSVEVDTCYFAISCPHNELALSQAEARRHAYETFSAHLPALDDDFPLVCTEVAMFSGVNTRKVECIFYALHRLNELPRTKKIQDAQCLLSLDHLIAIDNTLDKLGILEDEMREVIDATLVRVLTPRMPNQLFPTTGQLRRVLRDVCKSLDSSIRFRDPKTDPVEDAYHCYVDSKEGIIEFNTTPETGMLIDANVRAVAQEHDISTAQAFQQLLTGQLSPQPFVVLHAYQATDVPNAPTFFQQYGWLNISVAPRTVRDLAAECAASSSYTAPPIMRKRVEGRDGTCRYPGCNMPAWKAQLDHRRNFADGGKTHPDNLLSLCQRHHNMKTDQRVTYFLDPDSGEVLWLLENGRWVTTSPTGPLAPVMKRWVQRTAEAITAKRERAHREAQQLQQEHEQRKRPNHRPEEDDVPPPF